MPRSNAYRRNHSAVPVNYGSVGGTQAVDMLTYPPKGYRAGEYSARLGSGDERFESAVHALMTWGVQRASGIRVTDIEQEGTDDPGYRGVVFDDAGLPVERVDSPREAVYADDGTPYITSGTSVVLLLSFGPLKVKAPARVVYVIDEPNRVGFAYGTLDGHPASGEESFVVSRQNDGSVWLTIRQFSRPSGWVWRLGSPVLRLSQRIYRKRYLRALHPASGN